MSFTEFFLCETLFSLLKLLGAKKVWVYEVFRVFSFQHISTSSHPHISTFSHQQILTSAHILSI